MSEFMSKREASDRFYYWWLNVSFEDMLRYGIGMDECFEMYLMGAEL